jgi:hypothetical protein
MAKKQLVLAFYADEAAAEMGISRELAAFHLDRLVSGGLLVPEYRRLNDRTGPGAGRPAKLYRRSAADIALSLPPQSLDPSLYVPFENNSIVAHFCEPLVSRDAQLKQLIADAAGGLEQMGMEFNRDWREARDERA